MQCCVAMVKQNKKKFCIFFSFFFRPSPTRILSTSTTLPRNHLGSDQLYPEEYGVGYPNNSGGGGYFNPLEAMTSSPLRSRQVLGSTMLNLTQLCSTYYSLKFL